jgi:undecaprenyl-diphosphatase
LTFLQAIVIGIIQGFTELFPISSLGHTVLIPALIGGSWSKLVTQEASAESPYLAFVVGLHVATAVALIIFCWRDWVRIIAGFFRSIARRRVETEYERLAWLIVIATIPVGLLGLVLEHPLRVLFAKPISAAAFITVNAFILTAGHLIYRRRRLAEEQSALGEARLSLTPQPVGAATGGSATDGVLQQAVGPAHSELQDEEEEDGPDPENAARRISLLDAVGIGIAQTSALLAGISRDGICMVAGLARGLSRQDAARFAFLLSAPPIFAAGMLKVPDLLGRLGNGIRGQVLAGSAVAFVVALLSVWFLTRWFRTRSLLPMAVYCFLFGVACLLRFGLFGT